MRHLIESASYPMGVPVILVRAWLSSADPWLLLSIFSITWVVLVVGVETIIAVLLAIPAIGTVAIGRKLMGWPRLARGYAVYATGLVVLIAMACAARGGAVFPIEVAERLAPGNLGAGRFMIFPLYLAELAFFGFAARLFLINKQSAET